MDGTSNTIMVVEAGTAVPWTKPDDYTPGQGGLPPLGALESDGFWTVFADGSVRFIERERNSDQNIRLAMDPRDGRPIMLHFRAP
jgi:hypothetical protein